MNSHWHRIRFAWLLLLCRILSCSLSGAEAPTAYTIRGTVIERTLYVEQDATTFYYGFKTNGFELQCSGASWHIDLGTPKRRMYDHRVVSSDGTNAYLLLSYRNRHPEMNEAELQAYPGHIGDGTVTRGNLPRFSFVDEATPVWLPYASAHHFAQDPTNQLRQVPFSTYVAPLGFSPGDSPIIERTAWNLDSLPPHLPTRVTYAVDDVAGAGYGRADGYDLSIPLTNVTFEVKSFLETNGCRFPGESVTKVYRIRGDEGADTFKQTCQEFRVTATNVTFGITLDSFEPKLPGKTIVVEERFNNGTKFAFTYWRTNGWLSQSEVLECVEYLAARTDKSDPETSYRQRIVLIGLCVGVPIIGLLAVRARRQSK